MNAQEKPIQHDDATKHRAAFAVPGVCAAHRLISPGDENVLMIEEAPAFAKTRRVQLYLNRAQSILPEYSDA